MAEQRDLSIVCYWNEKIINGSCGVSYDGTPQRALIIQSGTTYTSLLHKMYGITGWNKERVRMKIICRYPTYVGAGAVNYVPLPIVVDEDIEIMINVITKHPELSNIDLYLEAEKKNIEERDSRGGSFIQLFDHLMNEIKKVSELAHTWLQNEPYEKWALAHDGGKRYGMMTTNISECFNFVMKGARNLPIIACVQLSFFRCVKYFNSRRALGISAKDNGAIYSPHVASKIEGGLVKATTHSVTPFNENVGIFQVVTRNGRTQIVRLDEETCTCGKWQIFHYPCSHVMAACQSFGINSWQYIASYYTIEQHVQTWSPQFFPLPQEEYWPPSALRCDTLKPNPNLIRCKKGRPSSSRIRNEMDIREGDKTKKRCGICKQLGHDRRTCPTKAKQPAR